MIKIARKIKLTLRNMRSRQSSESSPKPVKKRRAHHGFAFAQEPGNAPQVVDRIFRGSLGKSFSGFNKFSVLHDEDTEDSRLTTTANQKKKNKLKKSKYNTEDIAILERSKEDSSDV